MVEPPLAFVTRLFNAVVQHPYLYQDDAVLVVNKPTLLLSVPGRADDNKDCLITRLQENGYPEAQNRPSTGLGNLGIILLARDADTHRELFPSVP